MDILLHKRAVIKVEKNQIESTRIELEEGSTELIYKYRYTHIYPLIDTSKGPSYQWSVITINRIGFSSINHA